MKGSSAEVAPRKPPHCLSVTHICLPSRAGSRCRSRNVTSVTSGWPGGGRPSLPAAPVTTPESGANGKGQALFTCWSIPHADAPLTVPSRCEVRQKGACLDTRGPVWLWASHSPSRGFAFLIVKLGAWTQVLLCSEVRRLACHPARPGDVLALAGPFPSLFLPPFVP